MELDGRGSAPPCPAPPRPASHRPATPAARAAARTVPRVRPRARPLSPVSERLVLRQVLHHVALCKDNMLEVPPPPSPLPPTRHVPLRAPLRQEPLTPRLPDAGERGAAPKHQDQGDGAAADDPARAGAGGERAQADRAVAVAHHPRALQPRGARPAPEPLPEGRGLCATGQTGAGGSKPGRFTPGRT